jgi:formate dehydrogenase assembly factor FdhD
MLFSLCDSLKKTCIMPFLYWQVKPLCKTRPRFAYRESFSVLYQAYWGQQAILVKNQNNIKGFSVGFLDSECMVPARKISRFGKDPSAGYNELYLTTAK